MSDPALSAYDHDPLRQFAVGVSFGVGAVVPAFLGVVICLCSVAIPRWVTFIAGYQLALSGLRAYLRAACFVWLHAAGRMGTGGYSGLSWLLLDWSAREFSAVLVPVAVCIVVLRMSRLNADYSGLGGVRASVVLTRTALACAGIRCLFVLGVVPLLVYLPLSIRRATATGGDITFIMSMIHTGLRVVLVILLIAAGMSLRCDWRQLRRWLRLLVAVTAMQVVSGAVAGMVTRDGTTMRALLRAVDELAVRCKSRLTA